jgi:hypothetical protein
MNLIEDLTNLAKKMMEEVEEINQKEERERSPEDRFILRERNRCILAINTLILENISVTQITEYQILGNKKLDKNINFTFWIRQIKHFDDDTPHWLICCGRNSDTMLFEHGDFQNTRTKEHKKFKTVKEAYDFFTQTETYKKHFLTA